MPDPNLVSRVNGYIYSYTSTSHFFEGVPYKGVSKVEYKQSRKRVFAGAAQQDGTPLGVTSGVYRVESLSFTLLRDSADQLRSDLSAIGGGSYGDAQFSYMLQVFEPGNVTGLPSTTLITGCVIEEDNESQEFSEDGGPVLATEFTCKAMFVTKTVNGTPQQLWSLVRSLL